MDELFSFLDANCDTVYYPEDISSDLPYILCAMPGLNLGGSQTVFAEILELLIDHTSYNYCIFSPDDGEYRDIFINMGCVVCIHPHILDNPDFRIAVRTYFHSAILNSFLTYPYLMLFVNTDTPVFWWIHEPLEHIISCNQTMPDPRLLSPNIHIYGVADHVDEAFYKLYNCHTEIMHIAIHDVSSDYPKSQTNERVVFLMPAAYTIIKGHDILINAISQLPDEFRSKCLFEFCGYQVPGSEEYYDKIISLSKRFDCINHLGQLSKQELYKYYAECDCVIAPSRVDTGPATVIEGMMFGKLAVVSDKTGVSKYINDCVNGFVFHDVDELLKRLLLIISDMEAMRPIAGRGHEIWREHFSPESILDILLNSGIF